MYGSLRAADGQALGERLDCGNGLGPSLMRHGHLVEVY